MVSHFNIEITPQAASDITEIINYYITDCRNPLGASKVAHAIHAKIYSLTIFPARGKVRIINNQKIHSVFTGKFNIYFSIDEPNLKVTILRISYSHRNTDQLFKT